MPVISFVSPKGGVGKTTAALLLASELAIRGAQHVTLIDADPNLPLTRWARLPGKPDLIDVIADTGETTIVDTIADARDRSRFIVVDLEGAASGRVTNAVAMSDLAIVPIQASALDAEQAARAIALIKTTARARDKAIPYRILFTRVAASARIRTRNYKAIAAEMEEAGVPALTTALAEREAFRSLFTIGGVLGDLSSSAVSSIDTAAANAAKFAEDVLEVLRQGRRG